MIARHVDSQHIYSEHIDCRLRCVAPKEPCERRESEWDAALWQAR